MGPNRLPIQDNDNATQGGDPLLQAGGLWKSYRRGWWPKRRTLPVLRGASLTLQPGEIVGLVGENGPGKSTLMKALVGDLQPDHGTVDRTKSFGYCPQQPVLYERLTCPIGEGGKDLLPYADWAGHVSINTRRRCN